MQAKKNRLVQFVEYSVSTSATQLCSRQNPRDNARCGKGFYWGSVRGIQCRLSTSTNQLCSRQNLCVNARCGKGFHWARGGEAQRAEAAARHSGMGWLWLEGSLKLNVSCAEYCLFYKDLWQKRPIVLRSQPIVVTSYVEYNDSSCSESFILYLSTSRECHSSM